MNVLGYVSMMLLLLMFVVVNFQEKIIHYRKLEMSHNRYLTASRDAQNQFERKKYDLAKPRAFSKTKSTGDEQKKKPLKKHENMPECARLNLWPLFTEDISDVKPIFKSLIQTLYKKAYFDDIDSFVDIFISSLKEQKPIHLGKVYLLDPSMQSTYYAMLKGLYDHPVLLEYVKVEKMKQKICVPCADFLMVSALFGDRIAKKLQKEKVESDDRIEITKEKMEEYLLQEHIEINPNIWNHVTFNHPRKKHSQVTIKGSDHGTVVKREVTLSHS